MSLLICLILASGSIALVPRPRVKPLRRVTAPRSRSGLRTLAGGWAYNLAVQAMPKLSGLFEKCRIDIFQEPPSEVDTASWIHCQESSTESSLGMAQATPRVPIPWDDDESESSPTPSQVPSLHELDPGGPQLPPWSLAHIHISL